jgi:hypothetical protein
MPAPRTGAGRERKGAMKGKPIRIDWDDLEGAFNNKNEELVYYLDTVTGHVHLEGEGGEDDFDDDDMSSEPAPAERPEDGTRVYVEPPDGDTQRGWMREFVDGVAGELDAELAGRLAAALDGDDPIDGFRDALRDHDEGRDRWFLYTSDRLHAHIEQWIDSHEIQPADPPPWK